MHYSGCGAAHKGAKVLMPMRVASERSDDEETWVIYDTTADALDLGLQFTNMTNANLYAVEDPSFKWTIMGSEIGIG
jgi:hypothetical protein